MTDNNNTSIPSIENMGEIVNALNIDPQGANKVVVYTKSDNLMHDYFHYFEAWWDASNCLSGVILRLPKTEEENTKYWINYTDDVYVYLGNEFNTEVILNANDTDETYWDTEGLYPFFVGKIARIKERQNELEFQIDSIGRRFKAKIPDDFRQSYINNQNVRDAFQAICEFLGVYYICPPQTTNVEDEQEEIESALTTGHENNVENKLQKEDELMKATQEKIRGIQETAGSTNFEGNNEDVEAESGIEDIQTQGYADISFDANGSIVHGSTVIETSPDMAQTLLALEEYPLHGNYDIEENKWIKEDVEKLLNGEVFEELHNDVMNYGAITIEPSSALSSSMENIQSEELKNTLTSNDNSDSSNSSKLLEKTGIILGKYKLVE